MARPTTKRTLMIEGQMAQENTASSGLNAKSEALKLYSGPANARPKAQRLLELIADDDFEAALAHNASVAAEMPTAAAVEDWFLNRFEEWDEPALVKAKEDWAKAREQWLDAATKPKPMVWHNGRPYPAVVWEEYQRKKAASAIVTKFVQDNRDDLAARKPEEEPQEPETEEPTEVSEKPEEAAEGEIITNTQIALPITSTAAKAVALLNQKHHVIGNYGNKCVILSWELWEINRNVMIPTFQRFEDFKHRYMNRYVSVQTDEGSRKIPSGKFWLNHPDRRTYDSVAFRPNKPVVLPGNRLNLWRGFGVFPGEGSWKLMRDHIYDVLGAGDPQAGLYIERWLAYTVQHPDVVGETVLVLQGDEGTGKGTLARAMLKVFGPHGLPISQPKLLIGGFSGHLHYCCFLFLDEAFWAGDVQAEGRLKSLITEDTVTIEPKYFAPFQVPNLLHILMSSNSDWVVPAGPHARRYAVFKVSDKRMDDFAYFSALRSELDNGGAEAMLYDLLRLDLGDWRPRQIYKTAALAEQKAHSLRGLPAWIEQMLQEGSLPYGGFNGYPNRALTEDLTEHAKQFDKYTNKSLVPRELKKLFSVQPFGSGTARGWKFPPLPECRKLFEARFGPWEWHYDIEEWQRRETSWR
jgi:hypothetical protein